MTCEWPSLATLKMFASSVLLLAVSSGSGAVGAESAPAVRLLPYPFADVVSFASDVDQQRPWHGAAIHRVFNEEIGLTISDSLWPQGDSSNASSLFLGPGRLNRTSAGAGTEPTFALLLRQWHRGNIDHFHGWQEDGPYELRNEIEPPLVLSDIRTNQKLPDVHPDLISQMSQNVRFYFSAEPPPDLQIILHDEQGKSMSFDAGSIARGKNIQYEVGKSGWIVEVLIPASPSDPLALAISPMLIDRIELIAPSCRGGCAASLTRIERDHFSRQTVLSELPWLDRWNVRPTYVTSHGGDTLVQTLGVEGKSLDVPRTPNTLLADPAMVVVREGLADRKQSHAYYSDLLKRLSVSGVWSYFPEQFEDIYVRADVTKWALRMPPLTTTYEGFYNFPRTLSKAMNAGLLATGLLEEEKFAGDMRERFPGMPEQDIRSLYCGSLCSISQGNALASLLRESIYHIDNGKKIKHLWYTHFGSEDGGSTFTASLEEPVTPVVRKWMRKLANYVYNFDGSIGPDRRVWSPPANTWVRYQIMQAGIAAHVSADADSSSIKITRWQDLVTHGTVPEPKAGTRDLHGLTVYVDHPERASVSIGDKAFETFTRNPPDETGRASITIVDNNTPTSIVGQVALQDRGSVEINSGEFSDVTSINNFISIKANPSGQAEVIFKPWSLDLWNTSHLNFAIRKRLAEASKESTSKGEVTIEMLMEDGGRVSIRESQGPLERVSGSSVWPVSPLGVFGEWHHQTLDVTRLVWPKFSRDDENWRRPPLPLGRVMQVRIVVTGAAAGEIVDLRDLRALRPSGNGEAPDGTKLVAGRVTRDGMIPLPLVPVHATSSSGEVTNTTTDQDGYYFLYHRSPGEQLAIQARFEKSACHPLQGRKIEVNKNEAEVDIESNFCVR
jgi:hypothetical protein